MNESIIWIPDAMLESVASRAVAVIVHILWQGCVIGVIATIVDFMLRNSSAASRFMVNITAMMALLLCAAVAFVMSSNQATYLTGAVGLGETAIPWEIVIVALYASGVCAFSVKLVVSLYRGSRLCNDAKDLEDSILLRIVNDSSRCLRLRILPLVRVTSDVTVPIVVGIVRPIVLLPAAMVTGVSAEQFAAILSHEFAHIRRADLITNLIQRLTETVLFFHPIVWYLSHRAAIERELACDELVVSSGHAKLAYADALLRMAELSPNWVAAESSDLSASGGKKTQLEFRISKMLGDSSEQQSIGLAGLSAICLTLLLFVALSTISIVDHNSPLADLEVESTESGRIDRLADLVNATVTAGEWERLGEPTSITPMGGMASVLTPDGCKTYEVDANGDLIDLVADKPVGRGNVMGPWGDPWGSPAPPALDDVPNKTRGGEKVEAGIPPRLNDADIKRLLGERIDVDINEESPCEMIARLSRRWRIPMVIDDSIKKDMALSPPRKFTLRVQGLPRRMLLDLLLGKLGFKYLIERGRIRIVGIHEAANPLLLDYQGASRWVAFDCDSIEDAKIVEREFSHDDLVSSIVSAFSTRCPSERLAVGSVKLDMRVVGGSLHLNYRLPIWHRSGDYSDSEAVACNLATRNAFSDAVDHYISSDARVNDAIYLGEADSISPVPPALVGQELPALSES